MKRVTYWPQIFLGLAFNWGALMGWSAVSGSLPAAALVLYLAGIFWTLGYDTIYAHQDAVDDALIGVKSTALKFGASSKKWISGFYSGFVLLTGLSLWLADVPWLTYFGLVAMALHLVWQVAKLDIDAPDVCLKIFRANKDTGAFLFAGIILVVILIG
ncbi:UNVERIFIED_CONTAM: hypothetical protein GTU68_066260 [Idotea baltica]|nr:hypothetical protein [Idotea baltica]